MKKKISLFKITSIGTSALFVYLFIEFLFTPDSFVTGLGLISSDASTLLARRASMFMLGIAILMLGASNMSPSKARQTICLATGITLLGLSCTGWFEFLQGNVNLGIFVAIGCETILWVCYAIILIKTEKEKNKFDGN